MNREGHDWITIGLFMFVLACCVLNAGCLGPRLVIEHTTTTERVYTPVDPVDSLARAYHATVLIGEEYGSPLALMESCGSGALIAPNRILTVAHVVEHNGKMSITFPDGKKFAGRVVRIDKDRDLALVEFDGHAQTMPISIASASPRLMSSVWNLGAPGCFPGYMSRGMWGAMDEKYNRILSGGFLYPGMSGGPVVDETGSIVGVNDEVVVDPSRGIVPQMGEVVDLAALREFLQ